MKTTTLAGVLASIALGTATAHAQPLPLQNAAITATYNGDPAGMLGLDHQFATEPGSNTTGLDPTDTGVEFLTADFLFGIDFAASGALTVFANGAVPTGAYSMLFDFGSSLASPVSKFTFVGARGASGVPVLSIVNDHAVALDLGALTWDEFGSLNARIDFAPAVPEPVGAAMLLVGLAGLATLKRLRQPR